MLCSSWLSYDARRHFSEPPEMLRGEQPLRPNNTKLGEVSAGSVTFDYSAAGGFQPDLILVGVSAPLARLYKARVDTSVGWQDSGKNAV